VTGGSEFEMRAIVQQVSHTRTRPCPVLVLGLGNILLRDEGVGVRVVQALQSMRLPDAVEALDGATAGLALLDILADRRRVIVVDAIDGEYPPGTVIRLAPEDLAPPDGGAVSLHGLGLVEALRLSERLGISPDEVVILGVKPASLEYGLELSAELNELLPRIIELVLDEIDEREKEDQS
jgi:hydrogenase maturation protease